MAYQCTQPSLPPPIQAQQCSPEAQEPSASMSYQMKQACLPPPICAQPCPMERANAPMPPFVPLCNAVMPDPGPAASAEVSSSSGRPHAEQPCPPLPNATQPNPAEIVDLNVAAGSRANTEASLASSSEAMPAYVAPGSIVSLHPSGSITVRPGPVEGANASGGASVPYFS